MRRSEPIDRLINRNKMVDIGASVVDIVRHNCPLAKNAVPGDRFCGGHINWNRSKCIKQTLWLPQSGGGMRHSVATQFVRKVAFAALQSGLGQPTELSLSVLDPQQPISAPTTDATLITLNIRYKSAAINRWGLCTSLCTFKDITP